MTRGGGWGLVVSSVFKTDATRRRRVGWVRFPHAPATHALAHSDADLAVAVTGVAGPERDEDGNPVGLVYLACVRRGGDSVCVKQNFGDIGRSKIRYRAASEALTLLAEVASR